MTKTVPFMAAGWRVLRLFLVVAIAGAGVMSHGAVASSMIAEPPAMVAMADHLGPHAPGAEHPAHSSACAVLCAGTSAMTAPDLSFGAARLVLQIGGVPAVGRATGHIPDPVRRPPRAALNL